MALATDDFYALLIGVGAYESLDFPDLVVTVKDAEAIRDVLRDPNYCGYPRDNVHVLLGEHATIGNIRTSLQYLAHGAAFAGTVFIYFSGHGGRDDSTGAWSAYLCPRGADLRNLPETAISAAELSEALGAIAAQRLVLILDMCFAGGIEMKSPFSRNGWKSGWSDDAYGLLTQGSGRAIIASSRENQVSYVRSENDMSVFTYHLVQALQGAAEYGDEGVVRLLPTYTYVCNAVAQDHPDQEPVLKIPQLIGGDFPLALAAKRLPETEPTLATKRAQEMIAAPSEQQPSVSTEHPSVGVGIGLQSGDNNTNYIAKHQKFDQRNTRSGD